AEELGGGAKMPAMDEGFAPALLADFAPARGVVSARAHGGSRPKNVIQLVLESTGARYLSLYGSRYKTSPNLVAHAKNALVYDNFYAHAGFTANALASMSLSIHPYMTWREYTQEYPDFPGTTVADVLKRHGYRTGFLSS